MHTKQQKKAIKTIILKCKADGLTNYETVTKLNEAGLKTSRGLEWTYGGLNNFNHAPTRSRRAKRAKVTGTPETIRVTKVTKTPLARDTDAIELVELVVASNLPNTTKIKVIGMLTAK